MTQALHIDFMCATQLLTLLLLLLPVCLQAQSLTLGQLAAGSRGGGTALLYSSELQQHGLTAVSTKSGFILESWFNGTNSEVGGL